MYVQPETELRSGFCTQYTIQTGMSLHPPRSHVYLSSKIVHDTLETVTGRLLLKCDGTRTETRFRFPAKRTSPFKSAGTSVQFTTGSRVVRISGSNAG